MHYHILLLLKNRQYLNYKINCLFISKFVCISICCYFKVVTIVSDECKKKDFGDDENPVNLAF